MEKKHRVSFLAKTAFLKTSIGHHSCLLRFNIKSPCPKSVSVYFPFEEKVDINTTILPFFIPGSANISVTLLFSADEAGFPEASAIIAKIDGNHVYRVRAWGEGGRDMVYVHVSLSQLLYIHICR